MTFLIVILFSPMHACSGTDDKEGAVFKKETELQDIKPRTPVKIKLKRNKNGEYSWDLNGSDADDNMLESAHQELLRILTPSDADALSYFEYTTLLSMLVYKECEYVVMEAGLGGENDATAVFDKVLIY